MSSISVAPNPQVLVVRMRQLTSMVGLSRSSIYVLVHKSLFPAPIRLGPKAVGWRLNQIDEWLKSRPYSMNVTPPDK
jgi:prophage regulatory protein